MADEQGYNGWKNYETWCVSLWLDNDQGLYETVREQLADLDENNDDNDEIRRELADWLKGFVEDLAEMTCPGVIERAAFVADLFGAALGEVDWYEIATNKMIEFAPEERMI